ncbi:MAG: M13 family metallopeptidase N-terminal domain-containing protein, partial [Cyclobacteriaceae bacterium]
MKKLLITGITISTLFWSCQPGETVEENSAPDMPPGLEVAQMDTTVNPKEDFYRFANGSWLDKTEIPGDEGRWGGFPELREKNDNIMLEIMQSAAENPDFKVGSDERKALDFFAVGMDSVLAERAGVSVLSDWLAKINGVETKDDLQAIIAEMHRSGYGPFNGVSAFPNLMNSKVNSLYIVAGGLGLPNRDYYTKTDKKSVDIRDKYVKHIEKMLSLANVPGNTKAIADNIMAIENRLALASLT